MAAEFKDKDRQDDPPICVVGGVTVWSRQRGPGLAVHARVIRNFLDAEGIDYEREG